MAKYNRLLVGVDGSDTSFHALREAFKLSTSWITVVTASPSYEGDFSLVGIKNVEALIREPCEKALSRTQELAAAAGVQIRAVCAVGEAHERLVEEQSKAARGIPVPDRSWKLGPYLDYWLTILKGGGYRRE